MSNGNTLEYEDLEHGEVAVVSDGMLYPGSACMSLLPDVVYLNPLTLYRNFSPTAIRALPRPQLSIKVSSTVQRHQLLHGWLARSRAR